MRKDISRMKVSIVTIGDEILIGQIVDTNSAWLAQRLNEIGLQVHKIYSIPDREDAIVRTLGRACKLTDIVLVTGGLGPTNDDITKKTIAKYFNDSLERNEEVLKHINALFQKFGVKRVNKLNEQQADLPTKCRVLLNPVGTASAMWFEERNKHVISMPGVPHEMKEIMNSLVLPDFKSRFSNGVYLHKTILTQGVPESILAELLEEWEASLNIDIKLAYLPSDNRVRLRLSAKGTDENRLNELLDDEIQKLNKIIPNHIYGEEKDCIERRIGDLLHKNKATIATAESCTGGYLAHLINSVPGSSAYYRGSILAYDNKIKEDILQVNADSLKKYGPVSEQIVKEMALSVKDLMGVDYALSTSGIAGPTGGTLEKPVGTIWTAIAGPNGVRAVKYQFGSERLWNVRRSANALLLDLLHQLESNDKKIE